jgi:hypothetical protein
MAKLTGLLNQTMAKLTGLLNMAKLTRLRFTPPGYCGRGHHNFFFSILPCLPTIFIFLFTAHHPLVSSRRHTDPTIKERPKRLRLINRASEAPASSNPTSAKSIRI